MGYSKDIPILSVIGTVLAIIVHASATANNVRFKKEQCYEKIESNATGFKEASVDNLENGGKEPK